MWMLEHATSFPNKFNNDGYIDFDETTAKACREAISERLLLGEKEEKSTTDES